MISSVLIRRDWFKLNYYFLTIVYCRALYAEGLEHKWRYRTEPLEHNAYCKGLFLQYLWSKEEGLLRHLCCIPSMPSPPSCVVTCCLETRKSNFSDNPLRWFNSLEEFCITMVWNITHDSLYIIEVLGQRHNGTSYTASLWYCLDNYNKPIWILFSIHMYVLLFPLLFKRLVTWLKQYLPRLDVHPQIGLLYNECSRH